MIDYKKIIKSQNIRFKILNLLSWVPDKFMIKLQYRIKTGRKLNLKNPQRFSEKLQWYKLNYRNPVMHQCVDKYEVRNYVKKLNLENILNDLYGVYENVDDINFEKLPDSFVIKTTSGSGGQNVIICQDKNNLDIAETKKKLNLWLKQNPKKSFGREWAYEGTKNKIIIEKYLEADDLIDYKFFCFNGNIDYLYVISNRILGKSAKLGIYDANFNKIDAYRLDEEKQIEAVEKPSNFDKMCKYAKILSKDFPHARVDLYNINGKIYFGEITFYNGSGYIIFEPDNFDYEIGKNFKLIKYNDKQ